MTHTNNLFKPTNPTNPTPKPYCYCYSSQTVKYYDSSEDAYFYRNRLKLYVDEFRPRFLTKDLPTPRKNGEKGPDEYNSGVEDTSAGYLVLVTSTGTYMLYIVLNPLSLYDTHLLNPPTPPTPHQNPATDFHIGKWGELPSADALGSDHEALKGLFQHEFIGKFRPENVAILKNPRYVCMYVCVYVCMYVCPLILFSMPYAI
jgi:hypothetical protein